MSRRSALCLVSLAAAASSVTQPSQPPTLAAFTTVIPGSVAEQARDVTVDSVGNIIIVGGTESADFPVTFDHTTTDGPDARGVCRPYVGLRGEAAS